MTLSLRSLAAVVAGLVARVRAVWHKTFRCSVDGQRHDWEDDNSSGLSGPAVTTFGPVGCTKCGASG